MDSMHTRELFDPQILSKNIKIAELNHLPPMQFDFINYYYSIGRDLLRFNFERALAKG